MCEKYLKNRWIIVTGSYQQKKVPIEQMFFKISQKAYSHVIQHDFQYKSK